MVFKVGDVVYGKPGLIRKDFLDIRFEIVSISATDYTVIELDSSKEITRLREIHNNEIDFIVTIEDDALYLAEDRNDLSWWLDSG